MRNQQFTGTFGGNSGTNVLSPTQGKDPFLDSTPVPKPMNATRTGTTFAGTVSSRLPKVSNFDPGFNGINLPAAGRESMGRLGVRAADQDVAQYNDAQTAWNAQSKLDKENEIKAYEGDVARINKNYQDSLKAYNTTVTTRNSNQNLVNQVNQLATQLNTAAGIYRGSGSSYSKQTYNAALAKYNAAKDQLINNAAFKDLDGMFDGSSMTTQYQSPITVAARDMGYSPPAFRINIGGQSAYDRMVSVTRQSPLYYKYIQSGGRNNGPPPRHIGQAYNPNYLVGALGIGAYNPWSGELYNAGRYGDSDYKATANVPFAFGGYDQHADQNSWGEPLGKAPTRGRLPDAPDPIYEQRQMKEALPDVINRRLVPGQREVVGGDLPPQVANETGETFGQLDIDHGSQQFQEIEELNAVERQQLGSPKAYRMPSWYWTAKGQYGSGGGQTITPRDITNESASHYYIRNYGWVAKNQMTPLY